MGQVSVRCEVWTLDDRRTHLFLAARDGVKGETVPELRLDLLLTLLDQTDAAELADVVSETESYLRQLLRLRDSVALETRHRDGSASNAPAPHGSPAPPTISDADSVINQPDRTPLTVMLTRPQYAAVDQKLRDYMTTHHLNDAGEVRGQLLSESVAEVELSA